MARLSNEEMTDLAIKAQGGDEEALARLVDGCRWIIRHCVKHVIRTGSTVEEADLMAEGKVAVLECLSQFDPARGHFSPFVFPKVRRAVLAEASQLYFGMPIPQSAYTRYTRAMAAGNGDPTQARELVKDLAPSTFDAVHHAVTGTWHLSNLTDDEGELDMLSFDASVSAADPTAVTVTDTDERERIAEALDQLSEREREVLELVYGLTGDAPMSDVEASKVLGVAASTVCRARNRALKKLMALLDGAR